MTSEQKTLALQMRADGRSFGEIAAQLSVAASTIKYLCWKSEGKANMTSVKDSTEPSGYPASPLPAKFGVCRQCGAPLNLHAGNRMKRFCSENCRQKWWRAHPGAISDKATISVCAGCGQPFNNRGNPSRRYCSRTCYYATRFSRRAANE